LVRTNWGAAALRVYQGRVDRRALLERTGEGFGRLAYDAKMRLLLVEDDARIARFVAKGLREQSYAVDVAANGDDALYQAAINTYDLIVLDVMIPGRDGFAVCRELRAAGQKIPILMLTAKDAVEDRIAGLDFGADDYLTKPFEFRELLARLRALLRRSGELRPARIMVADLVLDTGARNVSRAGADVPMTTKEYALLEYLARNLGRVVGRAEIAEHVWEETFDPFSNLIEVYVNRLRRKIDLGRATPLLQTRRGAGYILGDAAEGLRSDGGRHDTPRNSSPKPSAPPGKDHA
jgi:DNA-binding response OmpR family regulator